MTVQFYLESCVLALIIVIIVATLIWFCYRTYQKYKATIMSSTLTAHEVRQGGISRFHHSPERKVAVSYDRKLRMESLRSELHCTSKQIADLRVKLDDATCELAAEKRKNKTLSVNLDNARQQMSKIVAVNDRLSRSIKDIETDSKDTQEFLMEECNTTMESLQEVENERQNLQSVWNEQFRQLSEELERKDLYVQMLQDELESTENRARDTLVSQGVEITGASLTLSEINNLVKCLMKSTILANSLSLSVLSEVRKLCKANGIEKDTKHNGIVTNNDDVNNGNDVVHDNATSLLHSVLQAIKNFDNVGKYTDSCSDNDINGQSVFIRSHHQKSSPVRSSIVVNGTHSNRQEMEKPNVPKKPDGLVPTSAKLVMQLSSSKDEQPVMKKKDGHYFLGIMDVEGRMINDIVTMLENELSSGVIPEKACGEIRSAIGKATLLTTKKFPQFKKLWEKNLNESSDEQFSTNSLNLEQFWDVVMFQVTDIHDTFRQIDKMRKNSWKEDALSATNGNKPRRSSTALRGRSKSAPTTEKFAAAAKARDEARKRLIEAKKKKENKRILRMTTML